MVNQNGRPCHVVTVGVREAMSLSNRAALGCLGVTTKKEQLPIQRAMAREAIRHLNILVRQYGKLNGRRRAGKIVGGGGQPNHRPSCATIPSGPCL
eukprot:1357186-Pyramimonas_sp.AAC.1